MRLTTCLFVILGDCVSRATTVGHSGQDVIDVSTSLMCLTTCLHIILVEVLPYHPKA